MGEIAIEGMRFKAFHGCYAEEAVLGNEYEVNLRMRCDTSRAEASDDVADTVNYQLAYMIVAEQMALRSHILEHVCRRILDALFAQLPMLQWAEVKVSKLAPAMGGVIRATSVTLVASPCPRSESGRAAMRERPCE